jgi:hypothetical protein
MKIIITESQIKKVIKEEKKQQLNESLSLLGWIFALSLGPFAVKLVWNLFKKYKKGGLSKKQFKQEVSKIKQKDNTGYYDQQEKSYYNNNDEYRSGGVKTTNIVIGDPQASVIAGKSRKANLIGRKAGESNLWYPGADVSWLKNALRKFPISPEVNNVIICIGTNGGFNPNDDVNGLFGELKGKFPNANFHTVQGSWGKGSNVEVELYNVERYYNNFKNYSNIIGSVGDIGNLKLHPHNPKIRSYDEIANEIDRSL